MQHREKERPAIWGTKTPVVTEMCQPRRRDNTTRVRVPTHRTRPPKRPTRLRETESDGVHIIAVRTPTRPHT